MVLLMWMGCRGTAPVPAHPGLAEVSLAVRTESQSALAMALVPFLVSENRLTARDAARWDSLRAAAVRLERADRRSERALAYGAFVTGCTRCHGGQGAPASQEVAGHGAGIRALEIGIIYDDPGHLGAGHGALRRSPDLADSHDRMVQLAGRLVDQPGRRSRDLAELYGFCVRCHTVER